MPRVSVLMGVLNCASTLEEALDSLYAQTYLDFKIILCEDGSTDNTYAVAKQYAEKHNNIVLIRNENNKGLNYTLNRCLEYADTEYCARMDGDDISMPTRFEKEVAFLDTHQEYAIVSSPMIHFDDKGDYGRGKGGYEPKREDIIYGPPFCHAPCMIRTIAYKTVGVYTIDPKLLRYEDYNLWLKMYQHNYRGFILEECLYKMRDDRNASRRRGIRARLNGIYAHYLAYKTLHLSLLGLIRYTIRVLIAGLIPVPFYERIHRKKLSAAE